MGARIVRDNTQAVLQALRKIAIHRMDASSQSIAETSQQLVPVESGALRDSMEIEGGGTDLQIVRYGNPEVDYAAIVESEQPFLRPAIEAGAHALRRGKR